MLTFFKQIKHRGDNFSYIIADETTKEAVVVDPSFNADEIMQILKRESLHAKYIINTHNHYDHTATNENLQSASGAKILAYQQSKVKDSGLTDGSIIKVGSIAIKVIHTPGHSPDSICLLVNGKVLTGDTLFVGECGRTDLGDGNPRDMYHSLFDKLLKLEDNIEVYPGHDYGVKPCSTIGFERKNNYTLKKRTLEEFLEFMNAP